MANYTKIIKEYPPDYCDFLEATYGKNMMSEGKEEGIDDLLNGVDPIGAKILDIGSGLGGLAFHILKHHRAQDFKI